MLAKTTSVLGKRTRCSEKTTLFSTFEGSGQDLPAHLLTKKKAN